MFIMYDSTDINEIPNGAHAIACYRNGIYENEHAARKRFPHSFILPISVRDVVACDCYDIERGDYRIDEAAQLVRYAHSHGIWRPCLYANESDWITLHQDLAGAGIARDQYRAWQAHYDGISTVPIGFDAKQFTARALGRNLDESVCNTGFFPPAKPHSDKSLNAMIEYDLDDKSWTVHGIS